MTLTITRAGRVRILVMMTICAELAALMWLTRTQADFDRVLGWVIAPEDLLHLARAAGLWP